MTRYERLFARLRARDEGALVPFIMLGDPDPDTTHRIVDVVVAAGADALELGIPFSDPVADGPALQRAAARALASGVTPEQCFAMVRGIRARHPELALGLLTYANLVANAGVLAFYRAASAAGADSVLVADVPLDESEPLIEAGVEASIATVFLLPHDAEPETTVRVARASRGYTYVLGRAGVTGTQRRPGRPDPALLTRLREAGGPPSLVGFGVGSAADVRAVLAGGAAGAIVGSALVSLLDRFGSEPTELLAQVGGLVRELKAATRRNPARAWSPSGAESTADSGPG